MVNIILMKVLDTKVVNAEAEYYFSSDVFPQSRSMRDWVITITLKIFRRKLYANKAACFKPYIPLMISQYI